MNAAEIIREVRQYNGTITVSGGYLNLRAPAPLPDQLLVRIRAHKTDLLMALSKSVMQIYRYRLTDEPDAHFFMIAPGCDLEAAEHSARLTFGDRLIEIKPHNHWRNKK